MNLEKLKDPFPESDIEWRIQNSGVKNGKPWGMCLAYVTNRAIMDRLDEVCGPENWSNRFERWGENGVLCTILIICGDGTATPKSDGAEETAFESVKGGLSSAMKRAAVQWGIGRYLYNLEAGWAEFTENGKYNAKIEDPPKSKNYKYFKWNPPQLPPWALPEGENTKASQKKQENPPTLQYNVEFLNLCHGKGLTEDDINDFKNWACNAKKQADFSKIVGSLVANFDKAYPKWMETRL
jgi:hypothetical protein